MNKQTAKKILENPFFGILELLRETKSVPEIKVSRGSGAPKYALTINLIKSDRGGYELVSPQMDCCYHVSNPTKEITILVSEWEDMNEDSDDNQPFGVSPDSPIPFKLNKP